VTASPWYAAPALKPPPHALVGNVYRLAEHERTAADDAAHAAGFALVNRLWRHAALAEGPVRPHPADASFSALAHDLDGGLRMRDDDDTSTAPGMAATSGKHSTSSTRDAFGLMGNTSYPRLFNLR